MGQYGEASIGAELQSINILKPSSINNYYFYYLNKHFLTRMKHKNRYKGQLLNLLLSSPNSKSLELVNVYKRFKQLKTYPKEQIINGNYIREIIDTDSYINNIINSIPNLLIKLDDDIIEKRTMVKHKYINIYEDYRFQNIVDNYTANINGIKFNSILSFNNPIYLNLNESEEVSLFFKDYIFTYLFQNFNYTDKTFNEPLVINNKDYYINTDKDYEIVIKVERVYNKVSTTDAGGNEIYIDVISGNNSYYIKLKSTEETTINSGEYLDLPILIEIPQSIVLPYKIQKSNEEFTFDNEIIGINIEYLFEYIDKDDVIIKSKTIPFSFIVDNNTLNEIDDIIIKPDLIYPISDEDKSNMDLNTIINKLKESIINLSMTKEVSLSNSNLYTIPSINLLNISYATLDAKFKISGDLDYQNTTVYHKCYPVEYYQPKYDNGELNANFRGTGWKDIRLIGDTSNLTGEEFIEARKTDEKLLLQSLNKLGFNLDSFAFTSYRQYMSYYDEQGIKRITQKFPFRNIFNREKDIKIANEGEPVYVCNNSYALFYGIEFNVSVHNGTGSKAMSLGETAYVYYFFETILKKVYDTDKLVYGDNVSNINFSGYYGTYKNNVDRAINIINCTYYKYESNNIEFNNIKNKIKNNKYYLELLTANTGKVYKLTSLNTIECISFNINYRNNVKVIFDNIKVVKDIITKPIKTNDVNTNMNNISLLADNMQEGVQFPINIESYLKVPPILRTDIYINSTKLALYSIGMGAIIKQEEWVNGLLIFANVLALVIAVILTIVSPPVGVAGIIGTVSGIVGSLGGLVVSLLFQAGIIDARTNMILNLVFGVIGLVGASASVANASSTLKSALDVLQLTTTIVQLISQTTQLAISSYELYNYDRTKKLENKMNDYINTTKYIQTSYENILDEYNKENSINIEDLMNVYYGNPASITPTQFYRLTKTIGFDYSMLYKAPEDISNYVENCLRLK